MINVKDKVYQALCGIDADLSVSDVYPSDWSKTYAVQYMEEANNVYSWVNNEEELAELSYVIYAWSNQSLSQLACDIDTALSALGLKRTSCTDANDPSGRRHKVMRYEGVIDCETEQMFWQNNR